MVRDVMKTRHGTLTKKTTNPHRDWFIGLVLFLVVAVSGSVLNARIHVQFTSIEPTIDSDMQTVVVYKQEIIDDALRIFEEREKKFISFESELNRRPIKVTPATTTEEIGDEKGETEGENEE